MQMTTLYGMAPTARRCSKHIASTHRIAERLAFHASLHAVEHREVEERVAACEQPSNQACTSSWQDVRRPAEDTLRTHTYWIAWSKNTLNGAVPTWPIAFEIGVHHCTTKQTLLLKMTSSVGRAPVNLTGQPLVTSRSQERAC
jgi:hypothetical protein